MKETIALFGAGGKMGVRLSKNLMKSDYRVRHVEPSEAGRKRLKEELGLDCIDADQALDNADVVILAIPDTIIGKVAHQIAPKLRPGTMVMLLDAAAPFAGHLPDRKDLTYFVAHPCHPNIFCEEASAEAIKDHFGGAHARQSVTSALMQAVISSCGCAMALSPCQALSWRVPCPSALTGGMKNSRPSMLSKPKTPMARKMMRHDQRLPRNVPIGTPKASASVSPIQTTESARPARL